LPVPADEAVSVSQAAPDVAVQAHPAEAKMLKDPDAAAGLKEVALADSV
jgi:hypothetical protein